MKLASVLIFCIWSQTGCCGVGYVVGSQLDEAAPDWDTLSTTRGLTSEDEVTVVESNGTVTSGSLVQSGGHLKFEEKVQMIEGPRIPSAGTDRIRADLVVRTTASEAIRIPADSIALVIVPRAKRSPLTGFVLGAAVDVAVVLIASSAIPHGPYHFP